MRLRSTRTLAAAVTGLALLAGGATALAASGSGSGSPGSSPRTERGFVTVMAAADAGCKLRAPFADPLQAAADYLGLSFGQLVQELKGDKSLADVATAHGKSVDGLKQAILDTAKSRLDEAVKAGDVAADEAKQVLAQLTAQLDDIVSGKSFTIKIERGAGAPALGGPFATAATYLGLSVDELTNELKAGKSLAEIATAHGKSADALEQALFDAAKADLQQKIHALVNAKGLPGPACGAKLGMGAVAPAPGFGLPGTP